jgi:hypothetical protein
VLEPAREERLACTMVAAHGLEAPATGSHGLELLVDLFESLEPSREQLEPSRRHSIRAKRIDDVAALERTDLNAHSSAS